MAYFEQFLVCAILLQATYLLSAQQLELEITAKEVLNLYIDGTVTPSPNSRNFQIPDTVPLVPGTYPIRLVALQALDTSGSCPGILASVTNDQLLTNTTSWKCSPLAGGSNWMSLGFIDEAWTSPVKIASNRNASECLPLFGIDSISPNAEWIWVSPATELVSYCRGYLPVCDSSPCLNGGTCHKNRPELCTCPDTTTGLYCETVIDACTSAPCMNGGTCRVTGDVFQCQCAPGYTGAICETTELDLNITAKEVFNLYIDGKYRPTSNARDWKTPDTVNLTSTSSIPVRLIAIQAVDSTQMCAGIVASVTHDNLLSNSTSWKCSPSAGSQDWMKLGFNDEAWKPAKEVASNADTMGCDPLESIPSISSKAYWIWVDSTITELAAYCRAYLPVCESSPCQNSGTCNQNREELCSCPESHTGVYCETMINFCASLPCQNNGTCKSSSGRYDCECSPGFSGVLCEADIDECLSGPCQNGGTCNDRSNGFQCTCVEGYTGDQCETDFDECFSNPCLNTGTCEDQINGYQCNCIEGYTGAVCETDVNECWSEPCQNGGTCRDLTNGYQCSCANGYTGATCETNSSSDRTMNVTADINLLELYVDGLAWSLSTNRNNWELVDSVTVSNTARVIAIRATSGGCGGILASIGDNYFITNDFNWKCALYSGQPGWQLPGYNDSDWSNANIRNQNSVFNNTFPYCADRWYHLPYISSDAYWIWSDSGVSTTTVCRGHLPSDIKDSPI